MSGTRAICVLGGSGINDVIYENEGQRGYTSLQAEIYLMIYS